MDNITEDKMSMMDSCESILSERAAPSVEFHRHCQKTVCSAYGYSGAGATWTTLYQGTERELENIQKCLGSVKWNTYFTRNNENITQDLRSILELIDKVAQQMYSFVEKKVTLEFWDNTVPGVKIAEQEINLANPLSTYEFKGFGRDITLNIDGYTTTFNTMTAQDGENLEVAFNRNDVTVTFNDIQQAYLSGFMIDGSDKEINIKQDYNKIWVYTLEDPDGVIPIDFRHHIYKRVYRSVPSAPPKLLNATLVGGEHERAFGRDITNVLEFEVHVRNETSSRITLSGGISVPSAYTPVKTWDLTALTDQLYVDPGYTNAYVFRIHYWDNEYVYSLAYIYRNNPR